MLTMGLFTDQSMIVVVCAMRLCALLIELLPTATLCKIERECSVACCTMLSSKVCLGLYAEMLQSDAETADAVHPSWHVHSCRHSAIWPNCSWCALQRCI